ncbi:MAG: hypothetical protein EOM80_06480 [Erysipelotrichia bacterium]|nr:hypothetical protein [Erysipelotrichia bacterium]
MNDKLLTTIKVLAIVGVLMALAYRVGKVPLSTTIDFSTMRRNLNTMSARPPVSGEGGLAEGEGVDIDSIEMSEERRKELKRTRARTYVESAINDYYQGSYEEALRRLDRARVYDPSNYNVFKLSGQIFFEKSKFRKAFNDWERANQLPNDDNTISRDLDILKRLIRYSRTEIDRLHRLINKQPSDMIAKARLKELEEQMRE